MPSSFKWLDYSEDQRRRVLDGIAMLAERDTRDELGLGGIRDAFADALFPGTSTIQRGAAYFLMVPWIYRRLESRKIQANEIAEKARQAEIALIPVLLQDNDEDTVIGSRAQAGLQRLPSAVYWAGLKHWGIRTREIGQVAYHRTFQDYWPRRTTRSRESDSDPIPEEHVWHGGLPEPPEEFPKVASLKLRRGDAEYLRDCILHNCNRSLMAYVLDNNISTDHPGHIWDLDIKWPPHLQPLVYHGKLFSLAMHGAQLLYNRMLAYKTPNADLHGRREDYDEKLHRWWDASGEVLHWDRQEFWTLFPEQAARLPTRDFVDAWTDLVSNAVSIQELTDSPVAQLLIVRREERLKKKLARLVNPRPLELWSGAAGAERLNLRWPSARTILRDIQTGLGADHA